MPTPRRTCNATTTYRAKRALVQTGLLAVGLTYEVLSKHADEMRREIAEWPDRFTFSLGVLPGEPAMAVAKRRGRLVLLGRGHHDAPLQIWIKHLDAALWLLTGLSAPHMAFAESRVVVYGAVDDSMRVYRSLQLVEKFLFPRALLTRVTKRLPTFTRADRVTRARLYASLGPKLAAVVVR